MGTWVRLGLVAVLFVGCGDDDATSDAETSDGGRITDVGARLDAPGVDVPGVDVPGVDVPSTDASGSDAGMCDCVGRECGDDRCGGVCGYCGAGQVCVPTTGRCTDSAMCGNGRVDPGEDCDGDCPTMCPDMMCMVGTLVGRPVNCNVRCDYAAVDSCTNGDGCCPSACTFADDDDCPVGGPDCRVFASWPADWAAEEDAALARMNRERAAGTDCASGPKAPVGALSMNRELRIAARCHSVDMAENGFFSHTGSGGTRFTDRARDAGYTGSPRAENIAAGNGTGEASVGQWMSSSTGHCDAIMNGGYNEVGIGYYPLPGSTWRHYWTAVFGSR